MSTDYSFYALMYGFMPRPEGYRSEKLSFLAFFVCGDGIGYCANLQFAPLYAHPYRSPRGHFQSLKADYGYFLFIWPSANKFARPYK